MNAVKSEQGTAKENAHERHIPYGIYEKYFKRLIDIGAAVVALLVLWWLFLILALLVRIKLGTPVIFKQERPGRNEKIFTLYKFRSMTDDRDENGQLLPDDMRTTKFGRLLRSTSLDELPELFNILKGDMSIVGPRPLLTRYLPYYTENERHRHDVRPGLTGLAQINGRNFINWEERFALDVEYVEHISFLSDCNIVLKTIEKVVKRQDIFELDNIKEKNSLGFQNLDIERSASTDLKEQEIQL